MIYLIGLFESGSCTGYSKLQTRGRSNCYILLAAEWDSDIHSKVCITYSTYYIHMYRTHRNTIQLIMYFNAPTTRLVFLNKLDNIINPIAFVFGDFIPDCSWAFLVRLYVRKITS